MTVQVHMCVLALMCDLSIQPSVGVYISQSGNSLHSPQGWALIENNDFQLA